MKPTGFATRTVEEDEIEKMSADARKWQTAGERLLLYLRGLEFPPSLALELALGALRAAEKRGEPDPVCAAMEALHELLCKRVAEANADNGHRALSGLFPGRTAPPVNRLPMVSERMFSKNGHRRKNGNGKKGFLLFMGKNR